MPEAQCGPSAGGPGYNDMMRSNSRMRRHEGGRRAIFPATIGWQKRKFVLHLFLGRINMVRFCRVAMSSVASLLTTMSCGTVDSIVKSLYCYCIIFIVSY